MLSFVVTLSYMGRPVILRIANSNGLETFSFEVAPLSPGTFPVLTMQFIDDEWKIDTPVPTAVQALEPRLNTVINAYIHGLAARMVRTA